MEALESGKPPNKPGFPPHLGGRGGHPRATQQESEQVGGEEGDTLIIGGFRNFADRTERTEQWHELRPQIPDELYGEIEEVIVPVSQCSIIIVKLKKDPAGPQQTRDLMRKWACEVSRAWTDTQSRGRAKRKNHLCVPQQTLWHATAECETYGTVGGF